MDTVEPGSKVTTSRLRYSSIRPALCSILLLISPLSVTTAEEPDTTPLPYFTSIESRSARVGILQIDARGEIDFAVESSEDLENWSLFRSIRTIVDDVYLLDRELGNVQRRYFRLSVPGRSAEAMRDAWEERSIESYRFRMTRTCFCDPHRILSATVTVMSGTVVNAEDATHSGGIPEPNPDASEFISIEELFDLIIESSGEAELVLTTYDETLGYPNYVEIDFVLMIVDDEIRYEVGDLEVLSETGQ